MTLATVAQASVSVFVSATCGRTPNALLHLWGRCRRQVLQFCKFRLVCLDGGFWPVQEQLLCSEHSEKSGRDRGCLDRTPSTQASCNCLPMGLDAVQGLADPIFRTECP